MSTATHAQLTSEILANVPTGDPAVLTAASLRLYLQDQIDSLNVAASTAASVNLSPYQPFNDTSSIGSSILGLAVFDGSAAATWGILNSTAHTIAITSGASITSTAGISSGSALSVAAGLTVSSAISATGSIASSAGLSVTSTATANALSLGSSASVVGFIAVRNATAVASTASQAMQMGTTANLGIYFATGQPTVSTAAAGSLCLSTGGSGPSTRVWVAGSTGNWIGVVAEA